VPAQDTHDGGRQRHGPHLPRLGPLADGGPARRVLGHRPLDGELPAPQIHVRPRQRPQLAGPHPRRQRDVVVRAVELVVTHDGERPPRLVGRPRPHTQPPARQHATFMNKNCPAPMRDRGEWNRYVEWWEQFCAMEKRAIAGRTAP